MRRTFLYVLVPSGIAMWHRFSLYDRKRW